MRRKFFYSLSLVFLISYKLSAQIEVAKLVGKNSDKYSVGFGAFINVGYQVSDASGVSAEASFLFFYTKDRDGDGLALVPFKLGYRYTFNGTGTGFYVQPQAGYNFFGANSYNGELPYKGPVLGIGFGYLFETESWLRPDIGIRFETLRYKGGSANYIALRFAQAFVLSKRDRY